MTDTLQHLRQLHQQAHEPPWVYDSYAAVLSKPLMEADDCDDAVICRVHSGFGRTTGAATRPTDAELIAAMRNALPALLDIAEAAEEYNRLSWSHDDHPGLKRLREALDRLKSE